MRRSSSTRVGPTSCGVCVRSLTTCSSRPRFLGVRPKVSSSPVCPHQTADRGCGQFLNVRFSAAAHRADRVGTAARREGLACRPGRRTQRCRRALLQGRQDLTGHTPKHVIASALWDYGDDALAERALAMSRRVPVGMAPGGALCARPVRSNAGLGGVARLEDDNGGLGWPPGRIVVEVLVDLGPAGP